MLEFIYALRKYRLTTYVLMTYVIGAATWAIFSSVQQNNRTNEIISNNIILLSRVIDSASAAEASSKQINNEILSQTERLSSEIVERQKELVATQDESRRKAILLSIIEETNIISRLNVAIDLNNRNINTLDLMSRNLVDIAASSKQHPTGILNIFGLIGTSTAYAQTNPQAQSTLEPEKKLDNRLNRGSDSQIRQVDSSDYTPSATQAFKLYVQLFLGGLVIVALCILMASSIRYIYSDKIAVSPEAIAHHQDTKKFAQDIVKTLVGFFVGIVTGILVGK